MRIVSYNILDGGEGRADPLAEVIEAQRADLIALVEADNTDVIDRISRRLKVDVIRAEGQKHAVALLSHWPIRDSINHAAIRGKPGCLLEATVADPSGKDWVLGITHLHSGALEADEAVRETEIGVLLEIFEPHRRAGRPHLLLGDFNANSPIQQIDPRKCKESTKKAWQANGGQIPRRVIRKLLEAGYVDTLHALKGDAAGLMGSFSTQFPGQRVDYVFAFGLPAEQIRQAWIEYDRLAKYASDHFPIGAEFG